MKWRILLIVVAGPFFLHAQDAKILLDRVRTKLEKVNNYVAIGTMKTNVAFLKAPVAAVKVYFKKPDKVKIRNEQGISFIPKGSVNISLGTIFNNTNDYDIIDVGKEAGTGLHIIKLLPREENAEVVLSTLYIDDQQALVKKAKTTTRDNGSYELEMSYAKYAAYGLPDKIIFIFNTSTYKLPKGITLDYDDGTRKKQLSGTDEKNSRVEITYSNYVINKGVDDAVFQ